MIIVLTTVSKKSDAEKLAKALVAKKLAACVNIIATSSIYRWKGKVVKEKEFLLLIKTAKPYEKVERFIKKHHSYGLPEIISFPIAKGYKKYLALFARSR